MIHESVLAEQYGSYVLFRHGDRTLLTFLLGGVMMVDQTVVIPEDEVAAFVSDPALLAAYVQRLMLNTDELFRIRLPAPVWPGDDVDS